MALYEAPQYHTISSVFSAISESFPTKQHNKNAFCNSRNEKVACSSQVTSSS